MRPDSPTPSPQVDPAVSYLAFLASVSDERLARVASRRAFVETKQQFMRSAGLVRGAMGPLLQRQVRLATGLADLRRLRDTLFDHLPAEAAPLRDALQQQLDSAFAQDVLPR